MTTREFIRHSVCKTEVLEDWLDTNGELYCPGVDCRKVVNPDETEFVPSIVMPDVPRPVLD